MIKAPFRGPIIDREVFQSALTPMVRRSEDEQCSSYALAVQEETGELVFLCKESFRRNSWFVSQHNPNGRLLDQPDWEVTS